MVTLELSMCQTRRLRVNKPAREDIEVSEHPCLLPVMQADANHVLTEFEHL